MEPHLQCELAPSHSAMNFHKICCNFCPCEDCIFIQAAERNPVEIRNKPFIFKIQNDIWKKTSIIYPFHKRENGRRSIKLPKGSYKHITERISCPPVIDPKPGIVTEHYCNHVACFSQVSNNFSPVFKLFFLRCEWFLS